VWKLTDCPVAGEMGDVIVGERSTVNALSDVLTQLCQFGRINEATMGGMKEASSSLAIHKLQRA
jgi:hypothetical protein